MQQSDSTSARVSVLLLSCLLKSGFMPDRSVIQEICGHPVVLRDILKKLVVNIENFMPRIEGDQLIGEIIGGLKFDAKVVKAVLALTNPPRAALAQIEGLVRANGISRLSVIALLAGCRTVLRCGIATVTQLFRLIRRTGITGDNGDKVVRFLGQLSRAELETVPPDEVRAVVVEVGELDPECGVELATVLIHKVDYLGEEIALLLASREATEHLDRWCNAFAVVAPRLPPGSRVVLDTFLECLTMDEITYGHITEADGRKIVQRDVVRRTVDGAAGSRRRALHGLPLCGWREIAALLVLAPPVPQTLELMTLAMEKHPRALVPAFRVVLGKFPKNEALAWVAPLLTEGQQSQCVAIDLLETLGPCGLDMLKKLMGRRGIGEIVKQKAARTISAMNPGDTKWVQRKDANPGIPARRIGLGQPTKKEDDGPVLPPVHRSETARRCAPLVRVLPGAVEGKVPIAKTVCVGSVKKSASSPKLARPRTGVPGNRRSILVV
jgi:hypothetical protein